MIRFHSFRMILAYDKLKRIRCGGEYQEKGRVSYAAHKKVQRVTIGRFKIDST